MARKSQTENVILETLGNIELQVTYTYEDIRSTEECHGMHDTSYTDVSINYVELLIAGESVKVNNRTNLLHSLSPKQISEIEGMLQIY